MPSKRYFQGKKKLFNKKLFLQLNFLTFFHKKNYFFLIKTITHNKKLKDSIRIQPFHIRLQRRKPKTLRQMPHCKGRHRKLPNPRLHIRTEIPEKRALSVNRRFNDTGKQKQNK